MKPLIVLAFMISMFHANAQKIGVALESSNHLKHANNIHHAMNKKYSDLFLVDLTQNDSYIASLRKLVKSNYKVINLSLQSCYYESAEKEAIKDMIKMGKLVVVASGNVGYNNGTPCKSYPANYDVPGMIVVGDIKNGKKEGIDFEIADTKYCDDHNVCLEGSSMATAAFSGLAIKLIKAGHSVKTIISIYDAR